MCVHSICFRAQAGNGTGDVPLRANATNASLSHVHDSRPLLESTPAPAPRESSRDFCASILERVLKTSNVETYFYA